MSVIQAKQLTMTYNVPVRPAGLKAALQSLLRREYRSVQAVKQVSFAVEQGEVVGFLGPNGAGKTTSLKMLSGVLHATGGEATVLGYTPWLRDRAYLKQMAYIRGSRPLAVPGELTVQDALLFQKNIYEVSESDYRRNVAELIDMLDLETLLPRQVRALSLGEKMRSGLAWALLYRPKVLFLDEPTLGLDVTAVHAMRHFLSVYRAHTKATILLTSHYMADVASLCERVILINHGEIGYDGSLSGLQASMNPYKHLRFTFTEQVELDWASLGDIVQRTAHTLTLRVPRERITTVTSQVLAVGSVQDFVAEEPPLEEVMGLAFREGSGASSCVS